MKVLVPPLLRDEYADKEAQERIVRQSDLEWIIGRTMILTNGPWTNDHRTGEDLKPGRHPSISRADVADFLMRQLTDDAYVRKTPAIDPALGSSGSLIVEGRKLAHRIG